MATPSSAQNYLESRRLISVKFLNTPACVISHLSGKVLSSAAAYRVPVMNTTGHNNFQPIHNAYIAGKETALSIDACAEGVVQQ